MRHEPGEVILGALLLLAGCGSSARTQFYSLSAVPEAGARASVAAPVQLAAVHVPPGLDRRQMVRMTDANTVEISETAQWSAPFDEMVRNVLAEDLVARLPDGRVILPRAPAPAGTRKLVVTLTQFGPDAPGQVTLNGSWALLDAGSGAPLLERDVHLDAGRATGAEATAAAMSQALGQLASDITSGLSRAAL